MASCTSRRKRGVCWWAIFIPIIGRKKAQKAQKRKKLVFFAFFAPFRGGPLRFAEQYGLKKLVDFLDQLANEDKKFTPCDLLRQHAQKGTKFYEE